MQESFHDRRIRDNGDLQGVEGGRKGFRGHNNSHFETLGGKSIFSVLKKTSLILGIYIGFLGAGCLEDSLIKGFAGLA